MLHDDSRLLSRRQRLELISKTLRTFRLTDDDGIAELFLTATPPPKARLVSHLRSSGVLLPPSITAEFLADRILAAFSGATPEPAAIVEVSCWDIDQFRPYKDVDVRGTTLPLRVPEQEIKERLNALLGELHSAADWGGEDNDIFSSQARLNGRELPIAFLLKGPSVPRPLRLRECGSNGDQVLRLTESPADLFVVQHVDVITEGVRRQLRRNVTALRSEGFEAQCAFIDGMQTAKIMFGIA